MIEEDPTDRILTFARHVGHAQKTPNAVARTRGWLDEHDQPTEAGRELLRALDEQKETDAEYRLEP